MEDNLKILKAEYHSFTEKEEEKRFSKVQWVDKWVLGIKVDRKVEYGRVG